jgi:hypothetical protein
MYHDRIMKPATPRQVACLRQMGVEMPEGLTAHRANRLIKSHLEEWEGLPPTLTQEDYLRRRDLWKAGLTRGEAARIIGRLKDWPDGY